MNLALSVEHLAYRVALKPRSTNNTVSLLPQVAKQLVVRG